MGGGRIAQTLLSFITVSILARALGAEQLGIYSILMAIFAYGSHFSDFGLRSIILSEWNNKHYDSKSGVNSYFACRLALSLLVCCIGYLIAAFLYPEYDFELFIVLTSTIFISLQLDWFLIANGRYNLAGWVLAIRPLAYLVGVIVFYQLKFLNLTVLVTLFVFSWLIFSLSTYLYAKGNLPKVSIRLFSFPESQRLLAKGLPLLMVALISQGIQNADLIFIGYRYGAEEAGQYFIANSIIIAGMVFANASSQIALGKMSHYVDDHELLLNKIKSEMRLLLGMACILAVGIYIFSNLFIPLFFGDQYFKAVELISYFLAYFVASYISGFLTSCMIVIGKQKKLMAINILRLSLLIVITISVSQTSNNIGMIALGKGFVEIVTVLLIVKYIFRNQSNKLID